MQLVVSLALALHAAESAQHAPEFATAAGEGGGGEGESAPHAAESAQYAGEHCRELALGVHEPLAAINASFVARNMQQVLQATIYVSGTVVCVSARQTSTAVCVSLQTTHTLYMCPVLLYVCPHTKCAQAAHNAYDVC